MRIGSRCTDLMKLLTFLTALLPLSLMAQIGTGPSVRMTNSSATGLTLHGTTLLPNGATIGAGGFSGNGAGLSNIPAPSITQLSAGFSNTNAALAPGVALRFGRTNIGNVQNFWEAPFSARLEEVNVQAPLGANASIYSPYFAGGGSGLRELPINNEIRNHQKYPAIGVQMSAYMDAIGTPYPFQASQTNLIQVLADLRTNGIAAAITNAGIPLFIFVDTWLDSHRDGSGNLTHNTNLFPLGMAFLANYCHTNAYCELWLDAYYNSENPIYPNTERDNDIAGGGIFDYPFGTNPNGTNPILPVVTPDTVHRDVNLFYDWGIDAFVVQDSAPYQYHQGYANQLSRQFNDAILYPLASVYWGGFKNTFKNKGMGLIILDDAPFFPSYATEANGLIMNVWNPSSFPYNHGNSPTNTSGVSFGIAILRAHQLFQRMSPAHSAFPTFFATLAYHDMLALQTNDIRGILAAAATAQGNVTFVQPINYPRLAEWVTNAGFLSVMKDDAFNAPELVYDGATNSIWTKQLFNPNEKSVFFANEGTSTTNLTVTIAQLKWPTNTVFKVTDMWITTNGTVTVGIYTNSYTESVTATNLAWRRFTILPDSTFNSIALGTNVLLRYNANEFLLSVNGSNILRILPSGQIRINTVGGGSVQSAAMEIRETDSLAGSVAIQFQRTGGAGYSLDSDSSTGIGYWKGYQSRQFSGLQINSDATTVSDGSELFRLTGGGYNQSTNAIGIWPTAATTVGGFALVNSNSIIYVLQSSQTGTAWTSTNVIGRTPP